VSIILMLFAFLYQINCHTSIKLEDQRFENEFARDCHNLEAGGKVHGGRLMITHKSAKK